MATRELRSTSLGDSYRVDVTVDGHHFTFDETEEDGGANTGPTPVQAYLAAFVGCLTISFKFSARRKKVPLERIDGWVAANDKRYIETVAIELEVWSSAPEADVRALLPLAERGCFVKATMKPEIAYSIELAVYPATGPAEQAPSEPLT